MADDSLEELLVAGYVPLCRSGFALPCYMVRPRANTWHVARCSIEGDHTGSVSGFEQYDAPGVLSLPEALQQWVRIGDPWLDVFIWGGKPWVGTPSELWEELRPSLSHLVDAIPLSVLDLALSANEDGVPELAEAARRHVEGVHGPDVARRWRRDFLVSQSRLAVRRQLASTLVTPALAMEAHNVDVVQTPERLSVSLPATLRSSLAPEEIDLLREQIRRLGRRLAMPMDLAVTQIEAGASPQERDISSSTGDGVRPKGEGSAPELKLLIISSGPRARAIARHISRPDWAPVIGPGMVARKWIVRSGGGLLSDAPHGASVIDVMSDDQLDVSAAGYGAVVWLLDDEVVMQGRLEAFAAEVIHHKGADAAVHLLAPALPTLEPSRVLADLAAVAPVSFPCHAVIDTSLARSPFWTGNPWRAIDRRIADTIVGSALLCATHSRLRAKLLQLKPGGDLQVISHALGKGDLKGRDPELGLVSEVSRFGLAAQGFDALTMQFNLEPLAKAQDGVSRGYAALRPFDSYFASFAEAVVSNIGLAGNSVPAARPIRRSDVRLGPASRARAPYPERVARSLRARTLAARLNVGGRDSLIITAEAPSLKGVRAALEEDYTIVRYTDRETISEFISGKAFGLPRELRLPRLKRLPANRGLAVRGVDPRDVVRFPAEEVDALHSLYDTSQLSGLVRGYRPRIDGGQIAEVAFPRVAVSSEIDSAGPWAARIAFLLEEAGERLAVGGQKRPSDLRIAWTEPGPGVRRFVLEDGRLPTQLAELEPGTVPAQRMFILDGDAAVPILFGSRLFTIWARATMSRSTSWLSRFSVSGTFETMPLPDAFQIHRDDATGLAQLRLSNRNTELERLAERHSNLDLMRRGGDPQRPIEERRSIRQDFDRALFKAIDLPADARDVDILDRMLTLNRNQSDSIA
ncbi:MAG TPA: hypothetical protein VGC56_07280 [Allosphingosinicella sp.]|jgi:hypothetical protein